MSTPTRENVRERMAAFANALSEKDIEFLTEMAREGEQPRPEEEEQ